MAQALIRIAVGVASATIVFFACVFFYVGGQIDQREHDQKCLATDAVWYQIVQCIDEKPR